MRSEEDFNASEMVDQTTIQIENIADVANDNDSEMSVSITQMPLPAVDIVGSNEMLTTNIPISSQELGTTMNSNMVDTPTTLVSMKSESSQISGEETTAATTETMITTMISPMASEDGTTAATTENTPSMVTTTSMISTMVDIPTTLVPIKVESNEIIMESTLPEIAHQTTKIPMKIESSEDETTAATTENTSSMVTTSSMVDIPTTVVSIKVDSSELAMESRIPEIVQTTKTPIKIETTETTIDLMTKMPEDQNTMNPAIIATSTGMHQPTEITTIATKIESTMITVENEHSTKFQSSSTAELTKEQTSEKIVTEKPIENSSHQIIISNLIWITILVIIFG